LGAPGNKFGLALDGRSIAPLAVDGGGALLRLLFRKQLQQCLALRVVFRFSELLAEMLEIVTVQELVHSRLPEPWTSGILPAEGVRVDSHVGLPRLQIGNHRGSSSGERIHTAHFDNGGKVPLQKLQACVAKALTLLRKEARVIHHRPLPVHTSTSNGSDRRKIAASKARSRERARAR
jgi:hypothetical protein